MFYIRFKKNVFEKMSELLIFSCLVSHVSESLISLMSLRGNERL